MTRLYFIHVAKIGGNSLGAFLWTLYHPAEICPPPPDWIWDAAHAAKVRPFKLILGHFDMDYVRQVGEPGLITTMLRNPYDRIRSLYDFWRSHTWQYVESALQAHGVRFAKEASFDQFLVAGNGFIRQRVWNAATRQLLGNIRYEELNGNQEQAAVEAFEVLRSLDWFGLAEFTRESLRRLAGVLQVAPPIEIARLNQTYDAPEYDAAGMLKREKVLKTVLLHKHCELIAETNRADILLYNWAVDRFLSNGSSLQPRYPAQTPPVNDAE